LLALLKIFGNNFDFLGIYLTLPNILAKFSYFFLKKDGRRLLSIIQQGEKWRSQEEKIFRHPLEMIKLIFIIS
jgi:hypothetical protein